MVGVVVVALSAAGCPGTGAKRDDKKSHTRLLLAKDFLEKGQLEAAETEANKALAYDHANDEAHWVLGLIDFYRGLQSYRLLEIDECLTGVDAEALREEFDRHLRAADGHFARAVEISPEYGDPWASRGVVATLLGEYDRAVEYLAQALSFPARLRDITVVRANLGWAHFHRRDYVAATKELLQSNQFQPGMCVATYRLGRVYFARKEWEKALEKFQDAVARSCPIQEAHLFLMKMYAKMERTDRLSETGEACVALAPRSCIAAQCRSLAVGSGPGPDPSSVPGSTGDVP